MTTYQRGPQLLKGALVSVDPKELPPKVVAFQFNPETLTRNLQPQTAGDEPRERTGAVRFVGAPVETLSVEIEIAIGVTQLVQGGKRDGPGIGEPHHVQWQL